MRQDTLSACATPAPRADHRVPTAPTSPRAPTARAVRALALLALLAGAGLPQAGAAPAEAPATTASAAASAAAAARLLDGATARQRNTAECSAALQLKAEGYARQIQAGQAEQRAPMRDLMRAAAALLGKAYEAGDRDEDRGHALMDAATELQKAWPAATLAARQASCQDDGRKLLDRANVVERTLMNKLADRRMNRLLELAAQGR